MKKEKMIISALVLVLAIGTAFAFKANKTLPGDLYYFNSESACVRAPCETSNNTGNACLNSPLYSDAACSNTYGSQAWTTDCGIK